MSGNNIQKIKTVLSNDLQQCPYGIPSFTWHMTLIPLMFGQYVEQGSLIAIGLKSVIIHMMNS